ncbi:MAG: hypothetical protein DHS20C18_15890 [Saprospiraceae bacterium]|nr:MAG: hypothetical protein DHS20C18_15890 [Saprospiraceae bacterium]
MKKFYPIFLFLFSISQLNAQQTGSFQQTVTFTETDYNATRTLYFYVPEDYDANQSYKLMVGFRGGPHDNAREFRDQLAFLADSIGAIILCPENMDHFWNEEGQTKLLFKYSVESVMDQYNIDPDYIYLTGLSYGGRHAVIVSMDTDDGPIPNIRGVIPFAAGLESELAPNYEDIGDFPPACICIGDDDSPNFKAVSNTLHNDLISNGGISLLNAIPDVGHTVEFPTYPEEIMKCINFIDDQAGDPLTLEVEPNPVLVMEENVDLSSSMEFTALSTLYHVGGGDAQIRWEIFVLCGPEEWDWLVSDENISYPPFVTTNVNESVNFPLPLEIGGESIFNVHIYHNSVPGAGIAEVKFSQVDTPQDFIYTATYAFRINTLDSCTTVVGIDELGIAPMNLYPNPLADHFQVSGNDITDKIVLYNTAGVMVKSFDYQPGQIYNMEELPSGIYMAVLKDKAAGILQTVRLVKY